MFSNFKRKKHGEGRRHSHRWRNIFKRVAFAAIKEKPKSDYKWKHTTDQATTAVSTHAAKRHLVLTMQDAGASPTENKEHSLEGLG